MIRKMLLGDVAAVAGRSARTMATVKRRAVCLTSLVALSLSTAFGVVVPARAQTAVGAENRRFMDDAAASGMAEIVLGRVAEEKAGSDAVRQFASHMVEDHNKANEELKALAAAKGVPLPTGLSSDQKAGIGKLKKVRGAGFDRAYMSRMLDDHRRSVALFERASSAPGDAEVKAFAARNLPVLRSHLEMAQQTSSGLAVAAGNKGAARGLVVKPVTRE